MNNLKNVVYQRLEAIAAAEKITRVELREISRELLIYVPDTDDIDIVNRLIGVLTPVNAKAAILYFSHFLPWDVERDADKKFVRFGKRAKGAKQIASKLEAIAEWLADDTNNIWTWADANIEIKQKDFAKNIASTFAKALEGDVKSNTPPLPLDKALEAVFVGASEGGVTLADMLKALDDIETTKQAEIAEAQLAADHAEQVTEAALAA